VAPTKSDPTYKPLFGEESEGFVGNNDADSGLMKTVRVVTTVQYFLER
jgi:hypothetical protein